jgi:hypothetical protein
LRTLIEHQLLLEYDHEKTWSKYGEAIHDRLKNEVMSDPHHPYWDDFEDVNRHYHAGNNQAVQHVMSQHAPTMEKSEKDWAFLSKHADPTPHQEYGQWLAKNFAKGLINRSEDVFGRAQTALARFHDAKKRKLLQKHDINPDINSHHGLSWLEGQLDKLPEPERKEDRPEPHEFEKHEDPNWTHIIPKTQKAACYYGRGTRWCTAATQGHNMFNHYDKEGDRLHVMVPKKAEYPGEKYQLHVGSNQFMNEKDEPRRVQPLLTVGGQRFSQSLYDHLNDTLSKNISVEQGNGAISSTHLGSNAMRMLYTHQPHMIADHPDKNTRLLAARQGSSDMQGSLLNDPEPDVRRTIAWNTINTGHFNHLAKDPDPDVRQAVAYNSGYETHHILKNDPDRRVRMAVAEHTHSTGVLRHLQNDHDPDIRQTALERDTMRR